MQRVPFDRMASKNADYTVPDETPEKIDEMYSAVLDHLLTPPQIKEGLMSSQSLEKKWQTVKMHQQLFEGGGANNPNAWGDRENVLLHSISKAKMPDLQSISRLKIILTSANRELMTSFLDSGGVSVLLRAIELRLISRPQTEVDIAVLYELLSCCKAIMNNYIGMEGFSATPGAIDVLARCLKFDYKHFALLVLEILSVCCYYSEKTAAEVLHGLRLSARFHQEAPFASICLALATHDIELKASIMQFINNLIMGIGDTNMRLIMRAELKAQLFDERLDETMKLVDKEASMLSSLTEDTAGLSVATKMRRRSLVTMYGPKAYDERKVDAIVRQMGSQAAANLLTFVSESGSIAGNQMEIKSKNLSVFVNPLAGTMAGMMHAAKNAEKMESKFLDMVGGKKTKRRWYELDHEHFKWCAGHDKEAEYKGSVSVATIVDIRNYTTDPFVSSATPHCFEFETTERIYALACETPEEKDNWLTALQKARDDYVMTKGSYKLQSHELSPADISKFVEMFKKQAAVYHSILIEDRKNVIETTGLDVSSLADVGRYLQLESIASGMGGKLLAIFYQLLLLPPGAHGVWDAVALGLDKLREQSNRSASVGASIVAGKVVNDLFQQKLAEGGSGYGQVNKLALTVMTHEKSIETLQGQIKELEKKIETLNNDLAKQVKMEQLGRSGQSYSRTENPISKRYSISSLRQLRRASSADMTKTETQLDASIVKEEEEERGEAVTTEITSPPIDDRYVKYDKMRKMLPEGAVRQKMMVDGFTEAEIEAYFSGAPLGAPPAPPAPPAVDERYAKYDKMRKMLPEGAVRQKMMVDGFNQEEIDAFFTGTPLASAAPPPPPAPAVVDERYAKYDKMRKMLPEGAVRQKMTVDGFTEAEIEAFFSGQTPSAPATAPAVVDERYAKYDKMRKMLPEGAVRQKMTTDGFTPQEIDSFFGGGGGGGAGAAGALPKAPPKPPAPVIELPPEGMSMKPKVKPKTKLKGLFWTKLKNDQVKETVWFKLSDFPLSEQEASQLEDWFSTKGPSDSSAAKKPETKEANTGPKLLSILDGKRTQSVLILLGKLRVSPEDLVQKVVELNPKDLDLELTSAVLEVVPTTEESTAVKNFTNPSLLDKASQLVFHFQLIPRLQQRLECHLLGFTWPVNAMVSAGQVGAVRKAIGELKGDEKKLEALFALVLAVGNYINGDTARGQAYGVKLDIFAKLVHMKAALPSQGSLMNFIALVAEQKTPELLTLSEQWMGVWAAAEINFKQLTGDINQLEVQLNKVQQEYEKAKEGGQGLGQGQGGVALLKRLDTILKTNQPQLLSLKQSFKSAEQDLDQLMKRYGEQLKGATSEEDSGKRFFTIISEFTKAFKLAIEENVAKRMEMEKAMKMEMEQANSPKDRGGAGGGTAGGEKKRKGQTENLFGDFHDAQKASANDVLAEFKMRLAKGKGK